jgi:hypothetical protein
VFRFVLIAENRHRRRPAGAPYEVIDMPASSNNLLPPNEAKRRTARIETDYLARRSPTEIWKRRLVWMAAAIPIGWFAIAALTDREQRLASRGPISHSHAIWENDCQACHVDFTPIAGAAAGLSLPSWAHASDANCRQCHAGPPHHEAVALLDADAERNSDNCATCHTEHRGHDADLARVSDRHCTVCHADLPSHSRQRSKGDAFAESIVAFSPETHPQFRSVAKDPGRLKFNHALHMTAGLMHAKDGRQPFKLSDLPPEFRARYQKQKSNDIRSEAEDALVQLDCSSCHELDRSEAILQQKPPDAVDVSRRSGEYYRPVVFERHCQACHPLPYRPDYESIVESQIPHRLSAEQTEQRVREMVLARLVIENPELQAARMGPVPSNRPPEVLTETGREWVEQQVQQSARYLQTAICAKCHQAPAESTSRDAVSLFPEIAAVQVPAVWLRHARFDHSAHRAVNCRDCHAAAYADTANASRCSSDVLVPNIDNCLQCHAPRRHVGGEIVGGARHDCAECHHYHARPADIVEMSGRGSALRGAQERRSIDQLLNFTPDRP